jgi:phosphocarrier protein
VITRGVIVTHPGGVHALVAQVLAAAANAFASSLYLRHEGRTASAAQPISVLALGIRQGAAVTVLADGVDESAALEAVANLLAGPTPEEPGQPRTQEEIE